MSNEEKILHLLTSELGYQKYHKILNLLPKNSRFRNDVVKQLNHDRKWGGDLTASKKRTFTREVQI